MEYGDIFVGTFRTIWHHKKLWLFAILGQLLATIFGGILGAILGLRFLDDWFALLRELMQAGPAAPGQLPGRLLGQFFALWGLFACLLALITLANYVVDLVMRGAIIHEAAMAWRGAATDIRRGLRTGADRAPYIFVLDVLWRVPLAIILGGAYLGGLVALILAVAGLASQGNQGGSGAAIFLMLCGGICCLLLLGLLIAVFVGIFQPLMYQSAVQGRRSLGEAITEGWHLARTHIGPMFVFWVLVLLVGLVAWLLLQIVAQPLSFLWSSSLGSWIARVTEGLSGGATPALPPLPPTSRALFLLALIVMAILGLFVNSFVATFNLTLYAGVYRRLLGGAASYEPREPGAAPAGSPAAESAPPSLSPDTSQAAPATAPAGPPSEAPTAATAPAPTAQDLPSAGQATRPYAQPDLGLNVPDQPPSLDEENRPRI